MRILLIDNDTSFAKPLIRSLKRNGMTVDWVQDGAEGLNQIRRAEQAITLLDIELPTLTGIDILKAVRNERVSPVFVVTARSDVDDVVRSLNLGADDYLIKPIEVRALLARIRAILRRAQNGPKHLLSAKDITLDPETYSVMFRGVAACLSAREFSVLYALMERPGVVLSRGLIENRIYGWNDEVRSNAIEVVIHSIRKKCGPDIIKNVRGAGWVVVKDVEHE